MKFLQRKGKKMRKIKKFIGTALAFAMIATLAVPAMNTEAASPKADYTITLPDPVIGERVSDYTYENTLPDEYDVSVTWTDMNESVTITDSTAFFEDGKTYCAGIEILCDEATEPVYVDIVANGTVYEQEIPEGGTFLYYECYYSFAPGMSSFAVNNIPTATIGGTVSSDIDYETSDNYTVTGTWYDSDYNEYTESTFGEDEYTFRIWIKSVDYQFANDFKFILDGVETQPHLRDTTQAFVDVTYDLRDTIETVEISGIPSIEVGDIASVESITIPNNANYYIQDVKWIDKSTGEEFYGQFEDKISYTLVVTIRPSKGYTWYEKEIFMDDGTTEMYTDVDVIYNEDHNAIDVTWWIGGPIEISYEYVLGAELIDNFELELDDVVLGEKICDYELILPEKVDYEITYYDCYGLSDIFEAGKTYYVWFRVEAASGYMFDKENFKVIIDGVDYTDNCYIEDTWLEGSVEFVVEADGSVTVVEQPVVESITTETVDKAIKEAKASHSDTAVVSVENAVIVEIPVEVLKDVVSEELTLTIKTAEAIVVFDYAALNSIIEQVGDFSQIYFSVEAIAETALNEKQQSALEGLNPVKVFTAEIFCDGENISDFNGGTVTVKIPFTPETGMNGDDYTIIYIADDGAVEVIETQYVDGYLVAALEHFSEYAIVEKVAVMSDNDNGVTQKTAGSPKTGDTTPYGLYMWNILGIVALMGVFFGRKKIMK